MSGRGGRPRSSRAAEGRFKASDYNVLIPLRRGRTLAYNGFSGALAVWEREDAACFERLGSEEAPAGAGTAEAERAGQLLHGGYVVGEGVDELDLLRRSYQRVRFDERALVLTIAPTLVCNFGCDYCFQGQDKPKGKMGTDVQDALLEMVDAAAPRLRRIGVAWYGGEPLLARDVIGSLSDRLIERCDRGGIRYSAMIVTNGYHLDVPTAQALADRRVETAQVTLDGDVADHDGRRALLGGKGTFNRILDNLERVADAGMLRLSIRINIDSRNRDGIRRLLDALAERGLGRRRTFGVYFAPVEAITEGCHSVASVCMTKSAYGQLEAELTRYAFARGLAPLPYPGRFRGVCGAVRPGGWVVVPNGDVHKCWDTVSWPHQRVGTVFEHERLRASEGNRRWLAWTPFENETCTACKLLPNCAGACAHKFLNADQTRGESGSLPCPSWKYNLHERLLFRAEQAGVIGPDDYDADAVRTDPAAICAVPYPEHLTGAADDVGLIPLPVLD